MTSLRASDLAAHRIRQIRKRRGWNARKLADRCAEVGAPDITVSVIANIESGRRDRAGRRRREVSIDELVALAYALGVPPVLLFIPLDSAETLQVTDHVQLDVLAAVGWATGDKSDIESVRADSMALELLRTIRSELERANRARLLGAGYTPPGAAQVVDWPPEATQAELADIGQKVARLSDWLASLGLTPPELPADIADAARDKAAQGAS